MIKKQVVSVAPERKRRLKRIYERFGFVEYMKNCEFCQIEPVKNQRRKYCSKLCSGYASRGRQKTPLKRGQTQGKNYVRIVVDKLCPACGGRRLFADCKKCNGSGTIPKRVYFHRWVWEQMTGETLLETEVIHHIDRNIYNNDFDNLEKFASQSEHMAHHAKTDWNQTLTTDENEDMNFWVAAGRREFAYN